MKNVNAAFLIILLTACGGGGGSSDAVTNGSMDNQAVAETASSSSTAANVEQSEEITASDNFDFRIDSEIKLSIIAPEGESGVAHIYGASDSNVPEGYEFPDFTSRITSINPALNPNAVFSYSGVENKLWIQWVPTSAENRESIVELRLVLGQSSYSLDLD